MLTRETITVEDWRTLKGAAADLTAAATKLHDTPFDYAFREALLSAAYAWRRLSPMLDFDVEAFAAESKRRMGD